MTEILFIIACYWVLCALLLWTWKRDLFTKTWQEPYFKETLVLIESDDWGPGGEFHADRLDAVLRLLAQHTDSVGRNAIITANMILAVPDTESIRGSNPTKYHRAFLDTNFPLIFDSINNGIKSETLVPQLHGLEHLNSTAFTACYENQDNRVNSAFSENRWWDWESLDSPLQGHYVDGSSLPSTPIPVESAKEIIDIATSSFERMFKNPSRSTVAPCYLWNNEIEEIWNEKNIEFIQTAGYRCTGRDKNGVYIQNPRLIRTGDCSTANQTYLVRNVMFEPTDGKDTNQTAFDEAMDAFNQALPISISTHRYNYTRGFDEFEKSISELSKLLDKIVQTFPKIRFLSSPELGCAVNSHSDPIANPFCGTQWPTVGRLNGISKISSFLYRLKVRHPKLVLLSYLTGLFIPGYVLIAIGRRKVVGY